MSAVWIPTSKHLTWAPFQTAWDAQREIEDLKANGPFWLNDGDSLTRGDIFRVGQTNEGVTVETLAKGTTGKILRATATDLAYSTFTIADTFALGSMPMASTANTLTALAVGAAGTVMGITAGVPAWVVPSVYLAHNLLSATHADTTAAVGTVGSMIVWKNDGVTSTWQKMAGPTAGSGHLLVEGATGLAGVAGWAATLPGAYTFSYVGTAIDVLNDMLVEGNLTTNVATTRVVYSVSGILTGSSNFTFDGTKVTLNGSGTVLSISSTSGILSNAGWYLSGSTPSGATLAANDVAAAASTTNYFFWDASAGKLTLGTNAIYSQGAHGQTLAADDAAGGSGASSYWWWDDSAKQFILKGSGMTHTTDVALKIHSWTETPTFSVTPSSGTGTIVYKLYDSGGVQRGQVQYVSNNGFGGVGLYSTAGVLQSDWIDSGAIWLRSANSRNILLRPNGATSITCSGSDQSVAIAQWSNTGTTTLATAQGDGAWGLTGAAQTWYDQSAATHYWYNASGTVSNQISSVAGTATVFNDTNLGIDWRVEAIGDSTMLSIDGTNATMGIGAGPSSTIKCFLLKSPTLTSGTFQTYRADTRSANASNSTATFMAALAVGIHQVAFNLNTIQCMQFSTRTAAGFSAGTLAQAIGAEWQSTISGTGATTDWFEAIFQAPTFTGTAPTRYTQIMLKDPGVGVGATMFAIRQQGTNVHSRHQATMTIGADAAPTNSATLDVQGALGVGAHGTTLANADAAFGSSTSSRWWYDDSTLTVLQYGTGAAIFNKFSGVAGTENVFNETGADLDTRIEGDTDTALLLADASLDCVVMGATAGTSGYKLDVRGKPRWTDTPNYVYSLTGADVGVPIFISLPTGAAATQAGWLKVLVNGTATYLPAFQ